jgi:hypothetical protein
MHKTLPFRIVKKKYSLCPEESVYDLNFVPPKMSLALPMCLTSMIAALSKVLFSPSVLLFPDGTDTINRGNRVKCP